MKTAVPSAALFGFWLALTGSLKPLDLAIGVVLSLMLGAWSSRYLWPNDAPFLTIRQAWRFLLYIPQLIWAIVVAAVQVAEVVLQPHMPVRPTMIRHRTSFTRDVSRVAFANSITLTPGTLTVDVEENAFTVHCIAERFAEDISNGSLERTISRVFEE